MTTKQLGMFIRGKVVEVKSQRGCRKSKSKKSKMLMKLNMSLMRSKKRHGEGDQGEETSGIIAYEYVKRFRKIGWIIASLTEHSKINSWELQ